VEGKRVAGAAKGHPVKLALAMRLRRETIDASVDRGSVAREHFEEPQCQTPSLAKT
jgi:hypothetical protein